MTDITEIIPDRRPQWFDDAMAECRLFSYVIERIEELEDQLRWRSVDDEPPTENGEYFVRDGREQHYRDWWFDGEWENLEQEGYTHWLPIPKLQTRESK